MSRFKAEYFNLILESIIIIFIAFVIGFFFNKMAESIFIIGMLFLLLTIRLVLKFRKYVKEDIHAKNTEIYYQVNSDLKINGDLINQTVLVRFYWDNLLFIYGNTVIRLYYKYLTIIESDMKNILKIEYVNENGSVTKYDIINEDVVKTNATIKILAERCKSYSSEIDLSFDY